MLRYILAVCVLASTPLAAGAWGAQGHRAMAEAARAMLSARARAHVVQIMGSDDLASVSTWADDVREASRGRGPLADNPEAEQFNAEFPKNEQWHFADIPLGEIRYSDNDPFSKSDDVVHTINLCIASLEGNRTALRGATKKQTLELLIHFVGDVHQPLHVGEGFYRLNDLNAPALVEDPRQAVGLPDDRGGNALFYTGAQELHELWDVGLVKRIAGTADYHALAAALKDQIGKRPARSAGDYHNWAEEWATDSLAAAREAYSGIAFGPAIVGERGRLRRIAITLPPGYDQSQALVARRQLALAAAHLAELLNALAWK